MTIQHQDTCEVLVSQYLDMLRADITVVRHDGRCIISTPFRRPDGELIDIEIQEESDGSVKLTDMGDTIGYLYVNGIALTRRMLDEAKALCRRYGVAFSEYELVVYSSDPQRHSYHVHSMIQAILAVTDLVQKRRSVERLNFDELVETYLASLRAVYDQDFQVPGRETVYTVRFHVDSGRGLLIQPLSAPNEAVAFSWAERWAYRFVDMKAVNPAWRPYAILDDREKRSAVWTSKAIGPLLQEATVVRWSENDALARALENMSERRR